MPEADILCARSGEETIQQIATQKQKTIIAFCSFSTTASQQPLPFLLMPTAVREKVVGAE
jgi:hypothetical protein